MLHLALQLCHEMFPPISAEEEYIEEDFSAYNFWHVPPPPLDLSVDGFAQLPERPGSSLGNGAAGGASTPGWPAVEPPSPTPVSLSDAASADGSVLAEGSAGTV